VQNPYLREELVPYQTLTSNEERRVAVLGLRYDYPERYVMYGELHEYTHVDYKVHKAQKVWEWHKHQEEQDNKRREYCRRQQEQAQRRRERKQMGNTP
jgi:hypothetical protein